MVALEGSEPLGHGHYLFITIDIRLEFTMPEVADHYKGAGIMLPREDQMSRGHVWNRAVMLMQMSWVRPIQIQIRCLDLSS